MIRSRSVTTSLLGQAASKSSAMIAGHSTAERLAQGVVTVVTVTSSTERIFPFQALVPAGQRGLRVDSKAQAEQVCSVAIERLGVALWRLSTPLMDEIDEALRLHLNL